MSRRGSPWLGRAAAFVLLGALLGGGAVYLALRPDRQGAAGPGTGKPERSGAAPSAPSPGVPSDFEPAGGAGRGVIALVLDDMGYGEKALARVDGLTGPIALAVLPEAPGAGEAADLARRKGWDLLVHLPLSSGTGKKEPGEISPSDDDAAIERAVARAIDRLPGAVGVNNHQGSAAMADRRVVRTLLRTIRDRHLFFLDSRTSTSRVSDEEAVSLGAPILFREVFLDAEGEEGTAAAWQKAVELAARKGSAIVIAHPHPATLDFLTRELPRLPSRGLHLVKVSELVD